MSAIFVPTLVSLWRLIRGASIKQHARALYALPSRTPLPSHVGRKEGPVFLRKLLPKIDTCTSNSTDNCCHGRKEVVHHADDEQTHPETQRERERGRERGEGRGAEGEREGERGKRVAGRERGRGREWQRERERERERERVSSGPALISHIIKIT